jgi:nitrite reductase/ring-hydroxylating ferredoxin subunit
MTERLWACRREQLPDGTAIKLDAVFSGAATSVILLRFEGRCYAYLNRCVHMGRALDAEDDDIFDSTERALRCSMHGIRFDPVTGESLSALCAGQRLTAIQVVEDDEAIWIKDRQVSAAMTMT